MKVLIIAGDRDYRNLFNRLGYEVTDNIEEAHLVCFTGGSDVSPHLYGEEPHPNTWSDYYRDEQEQTILHHAQLLDLPCVGICRGGQFLNVMGGGRMYQHVNKHAVHAGHTVTDEFTGEEVHVTSTHHQMMRPGEGAIIVATAQEGGFREWVENGRVVSEPSPIDYEVVAYPSQKFLCFQPHPEFTGERNEPMKKYFAGLLNKYLGQKAELK